MMIRQSIPRVLCVAAKNDKLRNEEKRCTTGEGKVISDRGDRKNWKWLRHVSIQSRSIQLRKYVNHT